MLPHRLIADRRYTLDCDEASRTCETAASKGIDLEILEVTCDDDGNAIVEWKHVFKVKHGQTVTDVAGAAMEEMERLRTP